VLMFSWVPCNLNSSCQNVLAKVVSQSDTIKVGIPCNLKIRSRKTCATSVGVKGWGKAKKQAYLERRSTTTLMTDMFPYLGMPTIKSMEIFVHMEVGMGRVTGCLDTS